MVVNRTAGIDGISGVKLGFAVEDSLEEIVTHIKRFHAERVVGRTDESAVEPVGSIR